METTPSGVQQEKGQRHTEVVGKLKKGKVIVEAIHADDLPFYLKAALETGLRVEVVADEEGAVYPQLERVKKESRGLKGLIHRLAEPSKKQEERSIEKNIPAQSFQAFVISDITEPGWRDEVRDYKLGKDRVAVSIEKPGGSRYEKRHDKDYHRFSDTLWKLQHEARKSSTSGPK